MKFSDPFGKKPSQKYTLIAASTQIQGGRDIQEDALRILGDECFVVADGVGGIPHGRDASLLAADTALWGYKLVRQRRFYWADKERLLARIFRSSNLTVWQKQKETAFKDGLATTLSVLILGPRMLWAGSIGDSPIILHRDGLIDTLTPADTDEQGFLTQALGVKRFGLVPHITSEQFLDGDSVLIATDGVTSFIDEEELRVVFDMVGETNQSAGNALVRLLEYAQYHGSTDNMTACIVKRVNSL